MANFDSNRFAAKTIEWETPIDFFNPLNHEFNFSLDVCATELNKKAEKYFSKQDDGLKQPWGQQACWMNPPYGREMVKWMEKAEHESTHNGSTVVCLIPARTNTTWWHSICLKAAEIRFVKGRPKFGDAKHGLPFPLAIIIFKPNDHNCKVGTYDHTKKPQLLDVARDVCSHVNFSSSSLHDNPTHAKKL